MKKRATGILMAITLLFATLLLAACSTGSNSVVTDKDGEKLDVIKLQTPKGSSVSPDFIADKLGFFAEAGIQPEYVGEITSAQQINSLVAGQVDVAGSHAGRTIAAISAGAKVKVVVAGTETSKEVPHMTYAVLENSPIRTVQDIVGKKVGIPWYGGCMEYTAYEYLRKNGIADPKTAFTNVVVPQGNEIQALRKGEIDVAVVSGNPDYVFKIEKGLRILFTDYDIWGTVGGNTPKAMRIDFIEKNPDLVRRYVAAYAKAENWINENPDKAKELVAQEFKIDNKDKVYAMRWAKDGIVNEDSIQTWIDIGNAYQEIKPGLKPSDIYTNEFNPHTA